MKKTAIVLILFFMAGLTFSQETNTVAQMDEAIRTLAGNIHTKLREKRVERIIIGQFSFQNGNTLFSSFWVNQLTNELVNISGRNYSILTAGSTDAEYTILGEIIIAVDTIRVFTRLVKTQDRTIEASFFSNFQRNDQINNMLISLGGSQSSQGTRSSDGYDSYEPDSWENPVTYTIGSGSQSADIMNRALSEGDEDFFLLIPANSGRLTVETTGNNVDTYMHFFNYDTEDELAEDDDGGQGTNARIVYNVHAGTRYLALVRGFSSSSTGSYGFRAFMTVREGMSSFENPISYEIGNGEDNVTSVRRTLQEGDEDYFLLIPDRDGRLTIETTGRIDTYMELYDADRELLAENDDGGQNNNAMLRYNVRAGRRYIALIRGYSSSVTGSYNFRAFFPGAGLQPPDEYEPDNEPGQAKAIQIGSTQQRTFHSANDVDWVSFVVTSAGRYEINATGVNNNRLDTYLELFDSNLQLLAEDDDGGDSLSARIVINLRPGTYFIKVSCLEEEPAQGYNLSIERQ